MSSTIGKTLKVTLFGESHGKGVGCVIEGLPPGMVPNEALLEKRLLERRPGIGKGVTPRKESDVFQWLTGFYQGRLTGAPVTLWTENKDTRSGDYEGLNHHYRPSHADFTGHVRYQGAMDPRGGGHFSARLTAPLVAAGALAEGFLVEKGIRVSSQLVQVGRVLVKEESPGSIQDGHLDEALLLEAEAASRAGDSIGGIVKTVITGVAAGLGSPIFDTIEGRLALALFGIPAVKGVEFGAGFDFAALKGSEANDLFYPSDSGKVMTKTNHSGGIQGGISNGMPIVHRCVFKATPSIAMAQMTLDGLSGQVKPLTIKGRHDPCVAIRGTAVVRAVTALVLADLILEQK